MRHTTLTTHNYTRNYNYNTINTIRGGREGYQSLLNTDMGLELDNLAR